MQNIEVVHFHDDVIQAVRGEGETVWVVVRRVCEALGVDDFTQGRKLKGKPWACTSMMLAHDSSGREQVLFCLSLDSLPMWLATIQLSKVKPEARQKLAAYQRECARVLRDHFFGRRQTTDLQTQELLTVVARVVETQNNMLVLIRSFDQRLCNVEHNGRAAGVISPQSFTRMRAIIRKIAEKEVLTKREPNLRAAIRVIYREIGEVAGWGGKAQKWSELPAQWESPVMVKLTRRLIDAERHADRLLARQIEMFPKAGAAN
jgi:hypothetical protein